MQKILTLRGWVDVTTVIAGFDYVYTHKHRWREVQKVIKTSFDEGNIVKANTSYNTFITEDMILGTKQSRLIVPKIKVNSYNKYDKKYWVDNANKVLDFAAAGVIENLGSNLLQMQEKSLKPFIQTLIQDYKYLNAEQRLFISTAMIKLDESIKPVLLSDTGLIKLKKPMEVVLLDNEDGSWFLNGLCIQGAI